MRLSVYYRPSMAIGLRCKHPDFIAIGTRDTFIQVIGLPTNNMPTAFAQQLIEQFGGPEDYKFAAARQLKTATKLSTAFAVVNRYEPWTETKCAELLQHHPVAIWTSLEVRLAPRAGVYGRMCTFYGGWGAQGMATPTTVGEMVALHGAIDVTYGGTGDPGTVRVTIPCDFDTTMQDILKAPYGDQGRPVFFYCFTEANVVDNPGDADRFMLTFKGTYVVKGRY